MNINDLKATLGSGASPTKFSIKIPMPLMLRAMTFGSSLLSKIPMVGGMLSSGPTSTPDDHSINVLVKKASIPEKTVGTVDVQHRGVKYVIRGVSEFPNRWDVTFHNTADLALRRFFEEWMYQIHRVDHGILPATMFPNNYFGTGSLNTGYMVDIEVSQHCQNGNKTANYELSYAFPVGLSAIELDSSAINTISEFTVTFAYSYWTAVKTDNTSIVDTLVSKATFGLL